MGSTQTPTFPDTSAISNNLHNNSFLPGFSSSPGWLLVTRTRGAWWCVIADIGGQALDIRLHGPESANKNDIVNTFTKTSIPIHPGTLLKQTNSKTLNSPNMTPLFSCPLTVQCAGGRRPANLAPAPHDCYTSESSSPRTVLTETFVRVFNNITWQQYPL